MAKNKFLRTCICCNEAKNKDELYRFTIINNEVVLDFYKKLEGRGFYVCKNRDCLYKLNEKLIKKSMKRENFVLNKEKIFNSLKNVIRENIYNLIKICNKSGKAIATTNRILMLKEKIYIMIVAIDIGESSLKKLKNLLDKITIIDRLFKKDELGKIFGKSEVSAVAILEKNLAEKIKNLYFEYLGV